MYLRLFCRNGVAIISPWLLNWRSWKKILIKKQMFSSDTVIHRKYCYRRNIGGVFHWTLLLCLYNAARRCSYLYLTFSNKKNNGIIASIQRASNFTGSLCSYAVGEVHKLSSNNSRSVIVISKPFLLYISRH